MYLFQISVLFILLSSGATQDCELKENCDECIQELQCFWCHSLVSGQSRCFNHLDLTLCEEKYREIPQNSYKILETTVLSESAQISPQKIRLRLRRNEKFDIKFQYLQSVNYPVDLYYIMDVSSSMIQFKKKLSQLGGELAEEMKKKTNNFRIGFGSFVDKLTLPFAISSNFTCSTCSQQHSFINHLSLTNNTSLFSDNVKKTKMSSNFDTPEGGMDALMQAIVCKHEIGWRSNARHLLIMSTDQVSHMAGDGKLGGIIQQHDGNCYMKNHEYTHSVVFDYPSVSHINYVARQNNINIIFAIILNVTVEYNKKIEKFYEMMSEEIKNSKMTIYNSTTSVVELITELYDEISDSVKITSYSAKDVQVNISGSCSSAKEGGCTKVKPGQTIDFQASITPLVCYKDPAQNKKIIKIKPEGLEDQLIIELEVVCTCNCTTNKQVLATECNAQGDLECGICRCNEGRFGTTCQCDRLENKVDNPQLCIKPGQNETCSGQGKCICGKCVCKERNKVEQFYGKYCECDNFSCPKLCSGRGRCDCGKCICDIGWSGPECDCSTDTIQCISPDNKLRCSNQGECVCGRCECYLENPIRYSGDYCERCMNCLSHRDRCDELKPCIECQLPQPPSNFDKIKQCPDLNCTLKIANLVEKLPPIPSNATDRDGVQRCVVPVEDGCSIVFEYSLDSNKNVIVTAEQVRRCRDLPPVIIYVLVVFGTILIIGIITLVIWRILTTMHDKKEYKKFVDEHKTTKWSAGENPLYKPGTSCFENPSYRRLTTLSSRRKSSW